MKGHAATSIFFAALLFGAVLVSPAFAQMKKVDDAELARTNASVTGASVTDGTAGAEKGAVRQDVSLTAGTATRGDAGFSQSNNVLESVGISLHITGQETFKFRVDGIHSETMGGVTGVSSHR
ncbi:MAG: hypothetical protein ACYDGO_03530 [Smithellaceae bacterium]